MTAMRTTAVTVRMGKPLAQQLTDQAQSEGTTCADILRKALEKYLDNQEQHAMLEDLRAGLLARLESLERSVVAEIGSLVEMNEDQGGTT